MSGAFCVEDRVPCSHLYCLHICLVTVLCNSCSNRNSNFLFHNFTKYHFFVNFVETPCHNFTKFHFCKFCKKKKFYFSMSWLYKFLFLKFSLNNSKHKVIDVYDSFSFSLRVMSLNIPTLWVVISVIKHPFHMTACSKTYTSSFAVQTTWPFLVVVVKYT